MRVFSLPRISTPYSVTTKDNEKSSRSTSNQLTDLSPVHIGTKCKTDLGFCPQTPTKAVKQAAFPFYFFSPLLSHLKEVHGSSQVSLSKFLLSDPSRDKHVEMLRNATPRKPKGQTAPLVHFAWGGTKPRARVKI